MPPRRSGRTKTTKKPAASPVVRTPPLPSARRRRRAPTPSPSPEPSPEPSLTTYRTARSSLSRTPSLSRTANSADSLEALRLARSAAHAKMLRGLDRLSEVRRAQTRKEQLDARIRRARVARLLAGATALGAGAALAHVASSSSSPAFVQNAVERVGAARRALGANPTVRHVSAGVRHVSAALADEVRRQVASASGRSHWRGVQSYYGAHVGVPATAAALTDEEAYRLLE